MKNNTVLRETNSDKKAYSEQALLFKGRRRVYS